MNHCTFLHNIAVFGSGGAICTTSESMFNVSESFFSENSASEAGGVIYVTTSSFIVAHSTFVRSSANGGGVIDGHNSTIDILTSTFTSNFVIVYGGVGIVLI